MLQTLARPIAAPAVILSGMAGSQHPVGWTDREPGRVTPEELAAEANFAKPMGAAQATMAKIAAASPNHATGHGSGLTPDAALQAQIIIVAQAEIPAATGHVIAPPGPAQAKRGGTLDLRA